MAIDPLRSPGGRIIQSQEPVGAQRRTATDPVGPATIAPSSASPDETPESQSYPEPMNLRKALVLARIQKDYYSQAHVRERVIDTLLQFLDED